MVFAKTEMYRPIIIQLRWWADRNLTLPIAVYALAFWWNKLGQRKKMIFSHIIRFGLSY